MAKQTIDYRTAQDKLLLPAEAQFRFDLMEIITQDVWFKKTMFQLYSGARLKRVHAHTTLEQTHNQANPSILRLRNGNILMCVRHMTYHILPYGRLKYRFPPPGFNDNQNSIHYMDENMNIVSNHLCKNVSGYTPPYISMWAGIEDLRLFEVGYELYAIAASNSHVERSTVQMLCHFNDAFDIDSIWYLDASGLEGKNANGKEKNWMPILGRDCDFIYKCDPTTVVHFDQSIKQVLPGATQPAGFNGKEWRGSSQLIPYGNNCYLACIHEAHNGSFPQFIYMHRVVMFDKELRITHATDLMSFVTPRSVEFCCGMMIAGDELTFSIGTNDDAVLLLTVSASEVVASMHCASLFTGPIEQQETT